MGQLSGELKQEDRKGLLARIPAFPPIVLRLLDVLSSDDVEIRELVSLVSSDPAFSAQILQVANSPLFGFRSQIDSVQSALVVLGLRRVRALTMTVATANHMKAVLKIEELSRCWRHMLACALLTEELARSCSKFEERAYTAGLLHDVGRLGLLLAHPTEYAELLRNATRNALELLDCEKNVLGMDHCEAGRLLAAQWNLPAELQIVAARHHDRGDAGPFGGHHHQLNVAQIEARMLHVDERRVEPGKADDLDDLRGGDTADMGAEREPAIAQDALDAVFFHDGVPSNRHPRACPGDPRGWPGQARP